MRATRPTHGYNLYNICILSFFLFLLCSTLNRACGSMNAIHASPYDASHLKPSGRSRRHNHNVRHDMQPELHHRPLTEAQKADQNLQYMLSLYRSAADPDGRPKQHRKFGSNTVRLLRPSTTRMRSLAASTDLHYTYTVEYDLHPLTLEQLVRASFVHLRSSSTFHHSPLRCRVRVTSPSNDSWTNLPTGLEDQRRLVTLESHQPWIETDITEHLASQMMTKEGEGNRLSLSAQYWCLGPGYRRNEGWGGVLRGRRGRAASRKHLNAPALLLFFDEEEEPREWGATSLTGASSLSVGGLALPDLHRARARLRRSKALPFIPNGRKSPGSIVSDIPEYRGAPSSLPKNQCKLYSYRVTFAALGMAHYVAPPQYNPHYCKGDCPRVLHYGLNPSNHAIMQTMIKGKGVAEVPSPSCVPYKYKPMSVLVLMEDKKTVDYKEIEDMIAELPSHLSLSTVTLHQSLSTGPPAALYRATCRSLPGHLSLLTGPQPVFQQRASMTQLYCQVSTGPIPSVDVQLRSDRLGSEGQKVLKRISRMTPLWRIMGTKPYGAYCHNNYECSTGICSNWVCQAKAATAALDLTCRLYHSGLLLAALFFHNMHYNDAILYHSGLLSVPCRGDTFDKLFLCMMTSEQNQ
ncbi:hypothetical protein DPEC_G00098480 [Dallia pectoralis]|uniref:Uncharacterized protein n=1 Tax=Dallia pectoralis TaxID=75939 RepID=A0ACC2GWL2_DALPE|nr:hypothetical protein DPEC_G00098480 [Dallia pectoralis]